MVQCHPLIRLLRVLQAGEVKIDNHQKTHPSDGITNRDKHRKTIAVTNFALFYSNGLPIYWFLQPNSRYLLPLRFVREWIHPPRCNATSWRRNNV